MGGVLGVIKEMFPAKPTWEPEHDMPDQTGRVSLVTGGNVGVGKETARHLLKKNAKVYLACRSKERAEAAIAELQADTGKMAIFLQCDLSSLEAVKKAADEFKSKEPALHVLYNSAGAMATPMDQLTPEGIDLQFGTNVLGHALLTLLLLDQLEAGAKSSQDGKARVVNVSSSGAYLARAGGIDFNTLKDGPSRRRCKPNDLYGQSKYGNYAFSCELAKRVEDKGIVCNALNPGNLATALYRHGDRFFQAFAGAVTYPVKYAPLTSLYVGTAPETANITGSWFAPWGHESKFVGPPVENVGPELWKWIEEQCKPYLAA